MMSERGVGEGRCWNRSDGYDIRTAESRVIQIWRARKNGKIFPGRTSVNKATIPGQALPGSSATCQCGNKTGSLFA